MSWRAKTRTIDGHEKRRKEEKRWRDRNKVIRSIRKGIRSRYIVYHEEFDRTEQIQEVFWQKTMLTVVDSEIGSGHKYDSTSLELWGKQKQRGLLFLVHLSFSISSCVVFLTHAFLRMSLYSSVKCLLLSFFFSLFSSSFFLWSFHLIVSQPGSWDFSCVKQYHTFKELPSVHPSILSLLSLPIGKSCSLLTTRVLFTQNKTIDQEDNSRICWE